VSPVGEPKLAAEGVPRRVGRLKRSFEEVLVEAVGADVVLVHGHTLAVVEGERLGTQVVLAQ
jgi:hypothetical protein